ncbi:hypothetical protein [Leisingera sp. NJS204]|uniref:hypothetical protein n=1 Tax=Leisingera sp. NJS204 TaxID=2508307 RepID=UPI0013E96B33|nr:hypothetical protein [Leisingera sp. NJS204]
MADTLPACSFNSSHAAHMLYERNGAEVFLILALDGAADMPGREFRVQIEASSHASVSGLVPRLSVSQSVVERSWDRRMSYRLARVIHYD